MHGESSAISKCLPHHGSSSPQGTTHVACPKRPGGHTGALSFCLLCGIVDRVHAHVSTSYLHMSFRTPPDSVFSPPPSQPPKIQTSPRLPPYAPSVGLSPVLSSPMALSFGEVRLALLPCFGSSWRTMFPRKVHRSFSRTDGGTNAAPIASLAPGRGASGATSGDRSHRASTFLPLHPDDTAAVECSSRIHASPRCVPSAPRPPKTKARLDATGTNAWPPRGVGDVPPRGLSARHFMLPSMRNASPRGSPSSPGTFVALVASCAKPP